MRPNLSGHKNGTMINDTINLHISSLITIYRIYMIQTIHRIIITTVLSLTAVNLYADPSDYGRLSDYSDSNSSLLSLDSTLGFIIFLIIGIFCAIIFFYDKKDKNSKGCGLAIVIMIILGFVLKCSH